MLTCNPGCSLAKTNLQLQAAHVLRDVIDQGRSLDRTLETIAVKLPAETKPALQEIAYGGVRYYSYFDGILSAMIDKPIRRKDRMVHFLLIAGMYQLRFMRTPEHAAVNQTVQALAASKQSWAKGLVNGVLRRFIREVEKDSLDSIEAGLAAHQRVAFPEFLFSEIMQAWPEQADAIFSGSNERPPLTLRINQQKTTREDYLTLLQSKDIEAIKTADSESGVIVAKPRPVQDLPMFNEGWVSVQDESAQLCVTGMELSPGLRVLDGCAAPGGKTCAMLETEPTLEMTAVDLPERVESIEQNLSRLGLNATVRDMGLEEYSDWWDQRLWNRVLLDVPCSGSGVIRRHPDIRHRRQPGDLERFATQQLEMLETAWQMLETGGILQYVTCSILPQENDDVIEQFLRKTGNAKHRQCDWAGGHETRFGRQRLPATGSSDGFYYCVLVKV